MSDAQALAKQIVAECYKGPFARYGSVTDWEQCVAKHLTAALDAARPKVDGSLRKRLLQVVKEFSDYLPEPFEPGDGDQLMLTLEPVVVAALDDRNREVWEKAAKAVENGNFLSKESLEYKWGMQVAAMLRRRGGTHE